MIELLIIIIMAVIMIIGFTVAFIGLYIGLKGVLDWMQETDEEICRVLKKRGRKNGK